MSEVSLDPFIELTAEVASAYLSNNAVPRNELPGLIASLHGALSGLGTPTSPEPVVEKPTPAVSIKKSVTDDYIVCLDDGRKFKSLRRHLAVLGMTPEDYRAKWSLPADYPMVAPGYAKTRSELARSIGLGRKRAEPVEAEIAAEPTPAKKGRPKKAA